ncbi:MAG: sigma-70 family RNA polymerase sigma factor [Chitinophagaceae bacterium]
MSIDLKEIQKRLGRDDQSALKLLYEGFSKPLFEFALAIIRSQQLAEEIVGDVFIKIWEKRLRVSTLENFKWYLYVTTRNTSYSYHRKYSKQKSIDLNELTLPYYQLATTPEDILLTSEALHAIHQAINNLPPRCRLIFKLVKEDSLKYREVAGLLRLDIKTVENQMGIALKKIQAAVHVYLSK